MMKRKKKRLNSSSEKSPNNIEYFFSTENTKFVHLLKITGKWKDLYGCSAGIVSIVLSIILSIICCYVFSSVDIEIFNDIIRDVSLGIFGSLIGMLGFIISGLAILTGTITEKLIELINEKEMVKSLIGILYSFYFIGAFIGISIISFLVMYAMSFPEIVATNYSVLIVAFTLSYMFTFSIFYSVALLGTCLRIFLVNYKFMEDSKEKNI